MGPRLPNTLFSTPCSRVMTPLSTQFPSSTIGTRSMHSDILYLEKSDRTVVPAKDEDFYSYTTKRWLSNNTANIANRYLRFNIPVLLEIAAQSGSHGAQKCVQALKFREGQYSKAFLLTFSDQSQLVAKLPNPNAGPELFTTASEVATMDFTRNILGLPVPRVLRWSCDSSNPVGSEYIIMEKAKGTPLGDVWFQLPKLSKFHVIRQVVDMESKLASYPFSHHGCIYYTEDLSAKLQQASSAIPGNPSKKFCLGPLVKSSLWENERPKLSTSQGPWVSLSDYATSLGHNEREWARHFVKPRMNYYRNNTKPELPSEYLDLVDKYLQLVPYLTASPDNSDEILQPTLWHNDLHLNNIYIDTETNNITDIIDWQGVSVAPLLLQARVPRMVRHDNPLPPGWVMPERPDNYDSLNESAKSKVDGEVQSALCHKYYEVITAKRNPQHYSALMHNDSWKAPYIAPLKLITGAWSCREVSNLRSSLVDVTDHWSELGHATSDCPITYTEEERAAHNEEIGNREYIAELVEQYQANGILPANPVVDAEDYEVLQQRSVEQKRIFLSMAESEEERAWMDKIWPYQDEE